jgi:hypothetical protein
MTFQLDTINEVDETDVQRLLAYLEEALEKYMSTTVYSNTVVNVIIFDETDLLPVEAPQGLDIEAEIMAALSQEITAEN